jgi:hypothetical protein
MMMLYQVIIIKNKIRYQYQFYTLPHTPYSRTTYTIFPSKDGQHTSFTLCNVLS